QAIQQRKLKYMLNHCMRNVPYYCRIFEKLKIKEQDLCSPEILTSLPLLDKSIIRENYNQLRASNITEHRAQKNSTSGSTGESLFFLTDKKMALTRMVTTFRNYEWCQVSPFDRQAMLWGARFDEPDTKSFADKLRAWTRPNLFLSSYKMTESQMGDYAGLLQKYSPKLLTSYPSPLEHFAYFCENHNLQTPSLRAIICSAEQLAETQRELFERVFAVPVFNRYGCREFGNIAQECEYHCGLHINTERVIIEVLRENGSECEAGEIGELVITDLDNEIMPFIRYRIGDMGSWSEKKCPCGRGLPLLEKIEGRVFDLIHIPSGNSISGTFWTLLLRHISTDILNFQIMQETLEKITIRLQMKEKILTENQNSQLRQKIKEISPELDVEIEYVDSIEPTPGGKNRFIISKL
ncbi:MAG: phenylacetate--CoA ligase family protein, partial [Calditrichia bacterium]|nr:phenylacetate--CoA ligase family protein [Calditrichia bacterium]